MRSFFLFTFVALLWAGPTLTGAAAPWTTQQDHPFRLANQSPGHRSRPWRRLSDSIIRRIWAYPERSKQADRNGPQASMSTRYFQDMVLRFNVSSSSEALQLAEACNILFLDIWEFNDNWVDIRLAKDIVPSLLGLLPSSLQHAHIPLMRDLHLAQAIYDTYPSSSADHGSPPGRDHVFTPAIRTAPEQEETSVFFRDYQPLSVLTPWMHLLQSLFPSHVRLIRVGLTFEGREILALRVGVRPAAEEARSIPRKTILVTGGSHARDWISVSTVTYLAYSLITSYGKSAATTALLESFDWVFVPTLNPDGYVHTWESDRLWRKNRQPTALRFCRGLDIDRGFGHGWDAAASRGNPCSESFAGEAPFDAVEAASFATWARNETERNGVEFVGFVDLQAYGQLVRYPYSSSCDANPRSRENLEEVALGMAEAIWRADVGDYGSIYRTASACEGNVGFAGEKGERKKHLPRIETGGGSALDWFYHEMGVDHAYQIKVGDTGSYGFLQPKSSIVPTGKGMLEAVLHLGRHLANERDGSGSANQGSFTTPTPSKENLALSAISEDNPSHLGLRRRRR